MSTVQAVTSFRSYQRTPATPVTLPYVGDDLDDSGLEPQYVKVKSNNQAVFTLNMATSPITTGYPVYNTDVQARRIRRLYAISIYNYWNIPNVNPRNNVLNFNANGVPYTITIPESYYTVQNLITTVVSLINAAVPGSWSLTAALVGDAQSVYTLSCNSTNTIQITGGSASWSDTSQLSRFFLDFRVQPNPVNSFTCSPQGLYTIYYDVSSRVITQDSKTGQVDLALPANQVHRQYIVSPIPYLIVLTLPTTTVFNVDPTRIIAAVDITLTDSSGQPLYIPPWDYNFDFRLEMLGEV